MKKAILFMVAVMMVVSLVACTKGQRQLQENQPKQIVKIGALLPMTGKESAQGEWSKRGLDLAITKVNQQSSAYTFEIIYGDIKTDVKETVNVYQNFTALYQIDFLVTIGSPFALALSPLVNAHQQILLAIAASPDYKSPDDYTFRLIPPSDEEAIELTNTLIDKFNIKKLALVYQNNDYGLGAKKTFRKNFEALGGKILIEESFNPDEFDFKSQIFKIKQTKPQTVFSAAWGKQAGKLIKQSSELEFKPLFVCGQACNNADFFEEAGGASEGVMISSVPVHPESEFYKTYTTLYISEPSYVPEKMYDAVLVVQQLKNRCGGSKECYLEQLTTQEFVTSAGITKFDQNGDINEQFLVYQVKNGKLAPIEN